MTLVSLALMSCSAAGAARPPLTSPSAATPSPSATASAVAHAGGCGPTAVVQGAIPQWLDDAGGHNNPLGVPYAVAHPPLAAGFLFGGPLRAGHPADPTNKILWYVRLPRAGNPLVVRAHPAGPPGPALSYRFPPTSGPGEIYPSIIDVPRPGCWTLDLSWGTHTDRTQLSYRAG